MQKPQRQRLCTAFGPAESADLMNAAQKLPLAQARMQKTVRIFLCGDVMTGRGIDQVLSHPCDPVLYESHVRSALDYVRLAEDANGPIPRQVDPSYVWGKALDELNRARPDARVVNLETAITRSDAYAPKGINYRMSPENAGCLAAAHIDCCVLGNNHILDWGSRGLLDTLAILDKLEIEFAGAGQDAAQAGAPAILDTGGGSRLVIFSFACVASGVPRQWAATADRAGLNILTDLSAASAARVAEQVMHVKRPGDVVIVSIHWGENWGYEIPGEQIRFAHTLFEKAPVSIMHGHSSHHPKAMEVYHNRLILYGCGDFLNDYEGIRGYEEFRDDLVLMYFVDIDRTSADLVALELVPLQIRRFQLVPASQADTDWLRSVLDRECRRFDGQIELTPSGRYSLCWTQHARLADSDLATGVEHRAMRVRNRAPHSDGG